MGEMGQTGSVTGPAPATLRPHDVDELVRRATEHPLGLDFLRTGSLDAVAAMFHVHAFVVDAARDALAASPVAAVAHG